jgi:hypothetical protein
MRADELMRRLISGELTNYGVVRTSPEPLQIVRATYTLLLLTSKRKLMNSRFDQHEAQSNRFTLQTAITCMISYSLPLISLSANRSIAVVMWNEIGKDSTGLSVVSENTCISAWTARVVGEYNSQDSDELEAKES